ncbi:hypothetical protein D3C81_1855450 [compost metagenome]
MMSNSRAIWSRVLADIGTTSRNGNSCPTFSRKGIITSERFSPMRSSLLVTSSTGVFFGSSDSTFSSSAP